jgi:hypothetical protein
LSHRRALFLQQPYILNINQTYYKGVLEEDRNGNKVHRPKNNNKDIHVFDNGNLAGRAAKAS